MASWYAAANSRWELIEDGRKEIEIVPTPMRLKKRGKDVIVVPDAELPTLTADQIRDTLERVRR